MARSRVLVLLAFAAVYLIWGSRVAAERQNVYSLRNQVDRRAPEERNVCRNIGLLRSPSALIFLIYKHLVPPGMFATRDYSTPACVLAVRG